MGRPQACLAAVANTCYDENVPASLGRQRCVVALGSGMSGQRTRLGWAPIPGHDGPASGGGTAIRWRSRGRDGGVAQATRGQGCAPCRAGQAHRATAGRQRGSAAAAGAVGATDRPQQQQQWEAAVERRAGQAVGGAADAEHAGPVGEAFRRAAGASRCDAATDGDAGPGARPPADALRRLWCGAVGRRHGGHAGRPAGVRPAGAAALGGDRALGLGLPASAVLVATRHGRPSRTG